MNKDDLLGIIQKGDWVFDQLTPLFREGLGSKLFSADDLNRAQDYTHTYLTSLYYRKSAPPEPSENHLKSAPRLVGSNSDEKSVQFWSEALSVFNRKVKLGRFDENWSKKIDDALSLIEKEDCVAWQAIKNNIHYICILETSEFRSASHPHCFGTLFLAKASEAPELAVSLLHELAHQELFLVNLIDRLINGAFDYNLVHAPFQGVKRPPIGRFHSAHALFRMIQIEKKIGAAKLSSHRDQLTATVQSFEKGELTPFGERIIHEVY